MDSSSGQKAPSKKVKESSFKSFLTKLRKRHIIETLAAFIAGGWLILEFVHWLLVDHYHFPEKTIDIAFVTILAALICTLIWRWFSGREEPRKFKLELVLIPLVVVITVLLDINLLLHLKGPEAETIPTSKWKHSIAVLPFVDMSPQKDQEYFCDGITENLINRLSNIRQLKVPARTSAFFFKGKPQDIQEIGKKLKVQTVLEGSIQKSGSQLRITAQLINIADGYHLWSEKYDRELKDVFSIQDEIALEIINKLKIELLGEERARVTKRYTDNTEAYDSYMRGTWLYYNKMTEEDWRKAILHFERAIEIDPDFSLAYYQLAGINLDLSLWNFVSPDEAVPKAKKALEQAIRIDPELPEALALSALIKFRFEYDWLGGESDTRKVLGLNPNCMDAHNNLGQILLANKGQIDKAIEEGSATLQLDPLSLYWQINYAWFLYYARRYDDAIRQCQKSLDIDPEYPWSLSILGRCYLQKTLFQDAIAALQKAVAYSGNSTENMSYLAYAYVMSGDLEKARETLGELDELSKSIHVSKYCLAPIYAAMENKNRAFELLEVAYEERDGNLIFLKVDPKFDVLRSDPRFEMMLKKIGLEK